MSNPAASRPAAAPAPTAPGPPARPWRDLGRYVRDPLGFLGTINERDEDVTRFRLGGRTYFFLSDPAHVRDFLVANERTFVKGRSYEELKRLVGEGLLTSEGELHRRQRRVIQPMFHSQRVAGYADLMTTHARRMSDRWQDGAVLDIRDEMSRLTLTVVGWALFDADVEAEAPGVAEALTDSMAVFGRFLLPFGRVLWQLPLPSTRRFERARDRLDELILRMIEERKMQSPGGSDLLSLLLDTRDDEGRGMSELQVRDETMTILLAGHETTAQALIWSWYLLGEHPDCERRLHEELDRVLGTRDATFEDAASLEYTRMTVAESMRLYPPAFLLARRAIQDHTIGGRAIPAESIVLASQFFMHRDARFFPDPLSFKPERWTAPDSSQRSEHAYFPFGAGARMCVGERFAWTEAILLLATLAQSWRLRPIPGQDVVPAPRVTLRPRDPLMVRLERRQT